MRGIVGSLSGKFSVAALVVIGVLLGLVLTGALPGVALLGGGPPGPGISAAGPAAGITLDFPASVLAATAAAGPADPVVEVIEEVVVTAPAAPRPAPAAPAPVPEPACVQDVAAVLGALAGLVPAVSTGEQAQALLAHASAATAVAEACLQEVMRVGYSGVETVTGLVQQAGQIVAELQALPVLAQAPAAGGSPNLVEGMTGLVGGAVGGAADMLGQGLGLLGGALEMFGESLR